MIGEVWTALTPYFDVTLGKKSFKGRPILIVAKADAQDYVVLPISKISRQENVDPIYDIKIEPATYPATGLSYTSYIRTHKQTIIHAGEIGSKKGELKGPYEDLFLEVLAKREQFSDEITRQAIEL